jgi:hypothetical protein
MLDFGISILILKNCLSDRRDNTEIRASTADQFSFGLQSKSIKKSRPRQITIEFGGLSKESSPEKQHHSPVQRYSLPGDSAAFVGLSRFAIRQWEGHLPLPRNDKTIHASLRQNCISGQLFSQFFPLFRRQQTFPERTEPDFQFVCQVFTNNMPEKIAEITRFSPAE